MGHNGLLKWRSHTDFEKLCSKVAYGGAADAEFLDLIEHLRTCADCRTLLMDFTRAIANVVPQLADRGRAGHLDIALNVQTSTSTGSFDIPTSTSAPNRWRWSLILAWCAPVFLCVALIASYMRLQTQNRPASVATPALSSAATGKNAPETEAAGAVPDTPSLSPQLHAALMRIGRLESALKAANQATADRENEKAQLQTRLGADEETIAEDKQVQEEQRQTVTRLEQQLADKESAIKLKDAELGETKTRLADSSEQLNHERALAASLTKVQELIAARNFHAIDVPPVQPVTSRTPAFGRILYAEGKQLMFYGYDLARSNEFANATFHVWGEKIGNGNAPASLGVFTSDDNVDSRWRLTFGDAKILAHIDRIFVTAESSKQATKPKGKTILTAGILK